MLRCVAGPPPDTLAAPRFWQLWRRLSQTSGAGFLSMCVLLLWVSTERSDGTFH